MLTSGTIKLYQKVAGKEISNISSVTTERDSTLLDSLCMRIDAQHNLRVRATEWNNEICSSDDEMPAQRSVEQADTVMKRFLAALRY